MLVFAGVQAFNIDQLALSKEVQLAIFASYSCARDSVDHSGNSRSGFEKL